MNEKKWFDTEESALHAEAEAKTQREPAAEEMPTHLGEEGSYPAYRRRRGIYLLPNLFTIAGLFAGFYAIVSAMEGYFSTAAAAIFVAMVMDFFDGRVARMTNTQSAFGAELDSLSDMVSFGVAPALVVYSWALEGLGKLGWLAAFTFAAAGALRLARFNTQVNADKRYFQGFPIPAGAGVLAALVWLCVDSEISPNSVSLATAILAMCTAVLMVSNLRYYSFKEIDLKGRVPFVAILCVVLAFIGIALDPPKVLFFIFFGYGLSGPILALWRLRKKSTRPHKKLPSSEDESGHHPKK